jgi:hypothetical protein
MGSRGNSEWRTVSILTATAPSSAVNRSGAIPGAAGGRLVNSELVGGAFLSSTTGLDSATVPVGTLTGNKDCDSGPIVSETGELKPGAGVISGAVDSGCRCEWGTLAGG